MKWSKIKESVMFPICMGLSMIGGAMIGIFMVSSATKCGLTVVV